jgi:hypothetical protein
MQMHVEVTDTFGGEANYCWVRRYTATLPYAGNRATIMRRAKELAGYSGQRGRVTDYGDMLEFRPYGICHVMFITFGE